MLEEMTYGGASRKRNYSLLYLALLCLLIYMVKSINNYVSSREADLDDTRGSIYVEIDDGTYSTVKVLSNPEQLIQMQELYNINRELKNGSKVILDNGNPAGTGRISGLKSLTLGIPIGINSATAEDLEALPGIGEKLALRIIAYRNQAGGFKNEDALLEVNGMGEKKLARIKPLINLD